MKIKQKIIWFIGCYLGRTFRLSYYKKSKNRYLWGIINFTKDANYNKQKDR